MSADVVLPESAFLSCQERVKSPTEAGVPCKMDLFSRRKKLSLAAVGHTAVVSESKKSATHVVR